MKDITDLKDEIAEKLSAKYCGVSYKKCTKDKCPCLVAAEIKSIMQSVIPDPYWKFSIKNFNGFDNLGEKIVKSDVIKNAKEVMIKYLWDGLSIGDVEDTPDFELDKKSSIDKRLSSGTNFIIYGNIAFQDRKENKTKKGRTLIASLIMKEAIKRRLNVGGNIQTYDWISFSKLKSFLFSSSKDESVEFINCASADWLVIDDITINVNALSNEASYVSSRLDSFLDTRLDDKKPNILVFRFDVEKEMQRIEDSLGVSVFKIVSDPNTFKIKLD